MPEEKVKLAKTGPAPKLEIVIGHENWGKYRAIIWNPTGSNAEKIVEGTNVDEVSDLFPLGATAPELDDRILTVELFIVSYESTEGEPFSASLKIRQGSTIKAQKAYSGNFGDGGILGRAARFRFKV